jgi:putative ABC transport system permease protein
MIFNYLKTALRFMLRQKAYSFINLAGLSVGIAAALIIVIYISDELSYDRFEPDAPLTYRLGFSASLQGNDLEAATTPAPVADAMRREIPEVTDAVRFGLWRTLPVSYGDRSFTEKHALVADSNFFNFFNFPLIEGDPLTALKGPNKMLLTSTGAVKYFGHESAIGQILLVGSGKTAYEITGIVSDPPANSHITFDVILSGESWDYMKDNQWTSNNLYTYFKVHEGADIDKVQEQLNGLIEKYTGPELEKYIGMTLAQFREQGNNVGLFAQPMLDIHLYSRLTDELTANGDIQYLKIFGAIALFILLIACINFMNLATARSASRAKEVGIRKTVGAVKSKLIFQFLTESTLYSLLSTALAIVLVGAVLTGFNTLANKSLTLSVLLETPILLSLIAFPVLTGVLAGSYPAFYLTAFRSAEVLKGRIRTGAAGSVFRNVLVTFQFVISIALIFGSLVVYRQLKFMQEKNLGFDRENVIDLLHTWSLGKNSAAFKDELSRHPEFVQSSYVNSVPPNYSWHSAWRKGGSEQDFLLYVYSVDYEHTETMGYRLKEGRFFSRDFPADTAAVVINEATFKAMAFNSLEEAEVISYQGDEPRTVKVIGILEDFNFLNPRDVVKPMIMVFGGEPNNEMAIRLSPGNTVEQIALLESLWKKYAPGSPFEYSFVDQNYDALFRAERRMSSIILIFTVLAISVACLGLFGLATYTAERRGKELSIRKVLGASVPQIIVLLTRNFITLVLVAFAVSAPLAWFLAESWLTGFANRISLGIDMVLLSGVTALVIAVATVSFQSIKASVENPVKAMRSE